MSEPTPPETTNELPRVAPAISSGPLSWTLPAFAGLGATALLGALLWSLVAHGWAHSFDTAIYVRSAWGAAHGSLWNSVRDLHVLSVHFNLVLFVLAPFVHAFGATFTLLGAQALAFGTTVGAGVRGVVLAAERTESGSTSELIGAAVLGTAVLVLATPLVCNPFLFDLRPDAIGVPLLTIGLLRMWRRGDVDPVAVAWLLSALLVREEYFMTIVGALAATPLDPRVLRQRWRLRLGGIVAAVGWWALYWFGIRTWIGDGSDDIAREVASEFYEAAGSGSVLWEARARLALAALGAGGGLALLGWRWAAAAGPGLLFLFTVDRMPELLLNVHYAYFAAPGLVLAVVAGFERLRRLDATRWKPGLLALPVSGALVFALCSAWPGGGLYRAEQFYLLLDADADAAPPTVADRIALEQLYELVDRVPDDVAVAAPHEIAAFLAARETYVPVGTYLEALADGEAPAEIDWIVLPGRAWPAAGRYLVEQLGFRVVALSGRRAALLTRDPLAPVDDVIAPTAPECTAPPYRWPAAGLRLCEVARSGDGELVVTLLREAEPDAAHHNDPLQLLLSGPEVPPEQAVPAVAHRGLLPPVDLPFGRRGRFVAAAPTSPAYRWIVLIDRAGEPLTALHPTTGDPAPAVPLPQ